MVHPDYDPDTVDNDVALLRIGQDDDDVLGDEYARQFDQPNAACLPDPGRPLPPPGTKCTIIGWGKKKASDLYGTDVLHEAEVSILAAKSSSSNISRRNSNSKLSSGAATEVAEHFRQQQL